MNAEPTSSRALRFLLSLRQQDWLALMLLALHAALVFGIDTALSKAFLLSHFGAFLLWQPVLRGEQKLYVGQALLIVGAAAVLVAAESWWFMALWISVLFALIGGEVPAIRNVGQRPVSLLAATYLLAILLIWVVPHLFERGEFSPLFEAAVRYGPLAPLAMILLVTTERVPRAHSYSIDLIYSVLLFLMVVVLVLGAFVIHQFSHGNYVLALAEALLVIAGILLALSWLWDPRAGFAGIGQVMNRYFMSVGMPFERWMHSLANLADQERDPDKFVMTAVGDMAALPWVSGIDWQTATQRGLSGHLTRHATECSLGPVRLTVYTRWSPSPTLVLHIRLLARLLADYYEAKEREQEQRRNAYMHAIYETGSRLTHDVKNLLQSLRSLCVAVERSDEGDAPALRRLLRRQLPQVAQRLQTTLDKLGQGAEAAQSTATAGHWWRELQARYAHERILFESDPLPLELEIPADLFDRVAENCLQNALEKRRVAPQVQIRVRLIAAEGGLELTVCDSGEALPEGLSRTLFTAPVASRQGLGVGLYQAARQATALGYRLTLAENHPGRVCFRLGEVTSATTVRAVSPPPPVG
jgi:signal transduction histidine kinase